MKALSKIILALTAVAALSFAYPASVQAVPTTYDYTGNPYTQVSGSYSTNMFVTVMVTLAGPLGANFSGTVSPTAFSLSDGVQTLTNLNATGFTFQFTTNASGAITDWSVDVTASTAQQHREIDTAINTDGGIFGDTFSENLNSPGVWTVSGQVPDTGSTLSLMTLTLMALALVAWRFKRVAA
jgi:hypothetical protein